MTRVLSNTSGGERMAALRSAAALATLAMVYALAPFHISPHLAEVFHRVDLHTAKKMRQIVELFRAHHIDPTAFHGVDGYGYGDSGRDKFDSIIAVLMNAESALARLQFFSGTHAISTALFACLRPGDDFLCVTGKPYDTLEEVIGLRSGSQTGTTAGSLKDWGIGYREVPLLRTEHPELVAKFDLVAIDEAVRSNPKIKLIHIQRSCGYQWRPSVPLSEIGVLSSHIRASFPDRPLILFCDNCYGELVEDAEPCAVGVDLVAGSLIKNLGGTLAPSGGYIAGKRHLIARCSAQLSAPGVEGGATFNQYRRLYQGLFMAPTVVGESLKGAELLSSCMGQLGFETNPRHSSHRTDIIQAVRLRDRRKLIAFCETVQNFSPVGAHIRPIPGRTSGYQDEVIFADGSFIEGSTLELSADGPLREPFVAYSQGCVHWSQWATVVEELLKRKEFSDCTGGAL